MPKFLSFAVLFTLLSNICLAQLNKGGIPLGLQFNTDNRSVPLHSYNRPAFEETVQKREKEELGKGVSNPYLLALGVPVAISFPESGTFITTADHHIIWRTAIHVDGVKGIGFCYNKFKLPSGVHYFISNENGKQLLGAYTASNNTHSGLFANEPIQGDMAYLELDIDPDVEMSSIQLHINRAVSYFRGVDYLEKYNTAARPTDIPDEIDSIMANQAPECMIDAICPLANHYYNQKRAALSIIIPDTTNTLFVLCSAGMINTAGNSTAICKRYLLTGSHCDQFNSTAKGRFDQMLLRFNYEQSTCNAKAIPASNTLVGATFIARSNYSENDSSAILTLGSDFLLLLLQENIPESWNVTLAGWNRDSAIALSNAAPKKFITFTHPDGGVKKVAAGHSISSGPFFNQITSDETHWIAVFDSGSVSPGSAGAPLFNGEGYLIGDLSGSLSSEYFDSCFSVYEGDTSAFRLSKQVWYSKLSYNWNHNDTLIHKLQPWLDPANTGVLKIESMKSNCMALDSVDKVLPVRSVSLNTGINVYPNPSSTGNINIQFNLADITDMSIDLIDFTGKTLKSYKLSNVKSGIYQLNTGALAAGIYMLRISSGNEVASRKIILSR